MDTRRRQTTDTRSRILAAAVELFSETTIEALTMQAIAERADVALRTVYNHFASKEALAVEAYDGLSEYFKETIAAIPADGSPRDRLGWFVDATYGAYENKTPGVAAVMGVTGVAELDAHIAAVRTWRREQLSILLRQAERDGSLRQPLKEAVALAYLFTSFGSWTSLNVESRMSVTAAKHLARTSLDATLFGAR